MFGILQWLRVWFQKPPRMFRAHSAISLGRIRESTRKQSAFARFMREYEAQNKAEEAPEKR